MTSPVKIARLSYGTSLIDRPQETLVITATADELNEHNGGKKTRKNGTDQTAVLLLLGGSQCVEPEETGYQPWYSYAIHVSHGRTV